MGIISNKMNSKKKLDVFYKAFYINKATVDVTADKLTTKLGVDNEYVSLLSY